ncbi:MAG: glycosyltransferase [Clostridiales bacterium]|nr:glycosyltransferase [Clostridiales bacterium]
MGERKTDCVSSGPEVSVIIPVYNAEKYLEECIRDVMQQTLKRIEIICVDDGSTDRSVGILNRLAAEDARIQVIQQENLYAGVARNRGFENATGKYVIFLDADDIFEPDMLMDAYHKMEETEAEVCVFQCNLYSEVSKTYKPCSWSFKKDYFIPGDVFNPQNDPYSDNIFRMFNGWAWDKMIRRDYILKNHFTFQNLRSTNDLYFTYMVLTHASRITTIDQIYVHQRVDNKKSISRTRDRSWNNFYYALLKMKDSLVEDSLYDRYRVAFGNYCVNLSLWQLDTVQGDAYVEMYELLQEEVFEKLGVCDLAKEEYFNQKEYEKIQKIMSSPMLPENLENVDIDSKSTGCQGPLVSVLMPSLNVGKYMEQCLASVMAQTLTNIEIICIDAGSTDGTLEIIQEAARKDSRITLIRSDRKSYGYQMNLGLKAAKGKYIGIVETDDYASADMYEILAKTALKTGADIVKSNYFKVSNEKIAYFESLKSLPYLTSFHPKDVPGVLNTTPAIWSALFSRDFLEQNHVDFLESPGASYQDTAFMLKAFVSAENIYLLKKAFYHYRTDNENSSGHSPGKVYCVCDEYAEVERFLGERKSLQKDFRWAVLDRKIEAYIWNYNRLGDELRLTYLYKIHDELADDLEAVLDEKPILKGGNRKSLEEIVSCPERYFLSHRGIESESTNMDVEGLTFEEMGTVPEQPYGKITVVVDEKADTWNALRDVGTEYVCLIGKADRISRFALSKLEECLEKTDVDVLAANAISVQSENGKIKSETKIRENLPKNQSFNLQEIDTRSIFLDLPAQKGFFLCRTDYLRKVIRDDQNFMQYDTARNMFLLVQADSVYVLDETVLIHIENEENPTDIQKQAEHFLREMNFAEEKLQALDTYIQYRCAFTNYLLSQTDQWLNKMYWQPYKRREFIVQLKKSGCVKDWMLEMEEPCYHEYFMRKMEGVLEGPDWYAALREKQQNDFEVLYSYRAKEAPLVSVVIPVYNTGEYLKDRVGSVQNQTIRSVEIICVNDGFCDDSLEYLRKMAETDPRIVVISQKNSGPFCARNHGLSVAGGRYVYFLDGDDYIATDALERMAALAEEKNLDVLLFDADVFYDDSGMSESESVSCRRLIPKDNYVRKYNMNQVFSGTEYLSATIKCGEYRACVPMEFMRREYLVSNGIQYYNGILHEDQSYAFEVLAKADRVMQIPERFYFRRVHPDSIMTSKPGFANIYGYFTGHREMLRVMDEVTVLNPETYDVLISYVYRHLGSTVHRYKQIGISERFYYYSLPTEECVMFENLVYRPAMAERTRDIEIGHLNSRMNVIRSQRDRRDQKIVRLTSELTARNIEIGHLNGRMNVIRDQRDRRDKEIACLTAEVSALKKQQKKLRRSRSYRLGRALTAPLRAMRRLWRKIRKKKEQK